jgi:hypothetical protein
MSTASEMTTKRVGVVSQRIKSDLSVSNGEGIVLQHLEAAESATTPAHTLELLWALTVALAGETRWCEHKTRRVATIVERFSNCWADTLVTNDVTLGIDVRTRTAINDMLEAIDTHWQQVGIGGIGLPFDGGSRRKRPQEGEPDDDVAPVKSETTSTSRKAPKSEPLSAGPPESAGNPASDGAGPVSTLLVKGEAVEARYCAHDKTYYRGTVDTVITSAGTTKYHVVWDDDGSVSRNIPASRVRAISN